MSEMFAFSFFGGISAEFNDLKIVQMGRGFRGRLRRGWSRLGKRQMANCDNN
jgi:hypothetical protein